MSKREIKRHLRIRDFKVAEQDGIWKVSRKVIDSNIHDLANMICQIKFLIPTAKMIDTFENRLRIGILFTLKADSK